MKVGFVGPGIMGRPMALDLPRGGHRLWMYGRRPEVVLPLAAAGAHSGSVVVVEGMSARGTG